jgi:polar amino acid transport system substrate-binding protein
MKQIAIAVVASAVVALAVVKLAGPAHKDQAQAESAYARVMRTGVLRCGAWVWPPYYDRDVKTGEIVGQARDIVDSTMSALGIKVEYVEVEAGQTVEGLRAGKFDAVCWDSTVMPNSAKYEDYTRPWYYMPVYAYANKASVKATNVTELDKPEVTFSGLDGDLSQELVHRLFPHAKLKADPATDPTVIVTDVVTGKANAVINDPISTEKFLATNGDKIYRVSAMPLAVYPFSFGVAKGQDELRSMLDAASGVWMNSGNYSQIMDKYDPQKKYFIRVARPDFSSAK